MRASILTLVVAMAATFPALAQKGGGNYGSETLVAIGNTELSAELAASGTETRVSGRMSVYLAASPEDLEKGVVRVGGWNLAFFSVPQAGISGVENPPHKEGLLGFATNSKEAYLRHDRRSATLKGEIRGFVDSSYLATRIKESETQSKRGEYDFFETLTQPATLEVEVKLEGELAARKDGVRNLKALVNAQVKVDKMKYGDQSFPSYRFAVREVEFPIQLVEWRWWEVAQRLCVQPVRIGRIQLVSGTWGWPIFDLQTTGTGLAFGQPGVTLQWSKADVTFQYRDWKTLWKPSYWVTTDAGTEEEELRAEVDDDDCIEVFFVNDFDPVDAHGGGAAWGGGTAGSKIITSDANARNGVDFTHLAHELGHVIGLHHPWESATANLFPASTGTLMCGSGFNNDNPTINSQENKDNLANPLLQFAIKVRSAGPDCQNDTDCGACP